MKLVVPLIIVFLLAYGAYAVFSERRAEVPPPVLEGKTYDSSEYGIAFSYPANYVLTEADGEGEHSITLIHSSDAAPQENSEGPTAITIVLYDQSTEKPGLVEWLLNSNASNFTLGDGTYASTTIAGTDAIRYRWSGLYEGETTAFMHGTSIVSVSVTYLSPDDQIRADYAALLTSFSLR